MGSIMPTQFEATPINSMGDHRSPSLRTIRRVSLKDTAVRQICQAIERGELKAGEPVTELGLARKLGIGQPTIREALLELEFIGFVEQVGSRTRVTLLTKPVIDEIYLVRTCLEALAVEIVARRRDSDLSACWKQVERMEEAAGKSAFADFFLADLGFHRALWRATQNHSLESSLERLVPKLFAFGIIQNLKPSAEELMATANLHRQLLELLPAGNVAAARRLMKLSMGRAWMEDAQLPKLG
jgi:DNA-binding GntR family transcriptional regulator